MPVGEYKVIGEYKLMIRVRTSNGTIVVIQLMLIVLVV